MNPFRRPSVRYQRSPELDTPYQRAAQVWDDRIGSARVQAKNWRLGFFGMMGVLALSRSTPASGFLRRGRTLCCRDRPVRRSKGRFAGCR